MKEWLKSNIEIDEQSKCWVWMRARDHAGYGRLRRGGETYTHRVSYKFFVGEIPADLEIDHICRNRACCNPDHLRLLTHAENQRRRIHDRECCPSGHPYDRINAKGARECKTCRYLSIVKWRARHPEKAREVSRLQKRKERARCPCGCGAV